MRKTRSLLAITILTLILLCPLAASEITFSGGYTKVSMQQGNKSVTLSGGASVTTDEVELTADSMKLYGENYRYVTCTGNVSATEKENGISFNSPDIFYDRETGIVRSDSWIEIQDNRNQASLSGAWFEYNMKTSVMKLQIMAKIMKIADEKLMICRADDIEYNGKENTVILRGNATVTWKDDTYKAAMIIVDLNTNDISLYGTISGAFNG